MTVTQFFLLIVVAMFSAAKFLELIITFPYGFVLFVVLTSTYRPRQMKVIPQ